MMLGTSPLPPDMPDPFYVPAFLKTDYPNAIDGDAVVFFGPSDAPELWVKYGSTWQRGWPPGSRDLGPGMVMTMEARPDYKRIIDDQTKRSPWSAPGIPLETKSVTMPTVGFTTATNVDAGKLALIGLIGFLLLRGAIK